MTTSPSPRVAADDLHRAIFDRSADALIVIDERMEVVEANLAAGELLGISADELVGRRLDGFTETSRLSELLTGDRENHLRAEPVSVRRPDGHVRHVEAVDVVEVSAGLTMLTLRSIIEQRNGDGLTKRRPAPAGANCRPARHLGLGPPLECRQLVAGIRGAPRAGAGYVRWDV
ncbi:MAG: PAS domain S-box protein [Tepidiformaceae bacterium]